MVGIEIKVTVLHGGHGGKYKLTLFSKIRRHFKLRPVYSGQSPVYTGLETWLDRAHGNHETSDLVPYAPKPTYK